jgi:hypothetical protein
VKSSVVITFDDGYHNFLHRRLSCPEPVWLHCHNVSAQGAHRWGIRNDG